MTTRRDALVAAGLAKPGRGKFSKDALAWLDAERAKGVKFSDDDGAPSRVVAEKPSTQEAEPTRRKNEPIPAGSYLFPSDYRFPESEYRAFARIDGKKVEIGMRECCNTCKVSLVNHGCLSPTVHDSIAVKIERR